MGKIRDQMSADLELRGLSPATCEVYLRYAQKFVASTGHASKRAQWESSESS